MTKLTYLDLLASLGVDSAHPGGFSLTKEVLKEEAITSKTKILDIGCGTGATACYLAKRYACSVTALDYNPLMLKKAQERCKRERVKVNLVQANAEKLPFLDNSFDLIIVESVTVFTSIPQTLGEYFRVLRKNGTLLDQEVTAEQYLDSRQLQEIKSFYGFRQVFTEAEWQHQFRQAGFTAINIARKASIYSLLEHSSPGEHTNLDPAVLQKLTPGLQSIFQEHIRLTFAYARHLGYRFFRVRKK